MEFLIDECAGPSLARWLRSQGHNVVSVYETARGADDGKVLSMAVDQSRVLITADKGFGERVCKSRVIHTVHNHKPPMFGQFYPPGWGTSSAEHVGLVL